jgi:7-dehydrocholesterol reductase
MAFLGTNETIAGQWGRAWSSDLTSFLGCFLVMLFSPLMALYFYISAFYYDCSLIAPISAWISGHFDFSLPTFTTDALLLIAIWLSLQVFLAIIPDKLHEYLSTYRGGPQLGAMTPSGKRLWYNVNGLQAWVISHIIFFISAFWFEFFPPTIIFDNWGQLFVIANIVGYSLAIYVYIKAYFFPSFPEDRKFSGNAIYDFFMGIELNPRIGPIDLKLFFNGRPGIVAWTIINISFAAAQYSRFGYITNSMLLVNLFHGLYVLYFFWKESWYLNTIDIHHDHFGWMLAWGDNVWLPYMYTLQGLFLVFHPVQLSVPYMIFVLAIGIIGLYIFISSNNQKDRFRRKDGNIDVLGKKAEYIKCEYRTQDGHVRHSKLLTSGWWGMARHMNYTGDLLFSLAYSLACGFGYLFPYFYFIFMTILLVHRCIRDEHRCRHKYGQAWVDYCNRVPYRLIPGVF